MDKSLRSITFSHLSCENYIIFRIWYPEQVHPLGYWLIGRLFSLFEHQSLGQFPWNNLSVTHKRYHNRIQDAFFKLVHFYTGNIIIRFHKHEGILQFLGMNAQSLRFVLYFLWKVNVFKCIFVNLSTFFFFFRERLFTTRIHNDL